MESAFGRLFRSSRLASFDPQIKQVYTAHGPASRAHGVWGLKRDMPVGLRTKLVYLHALDTKEHQTNLSSAQSAVLHMRRWRENFPTSRKPVVPSSVPQTHISLLNRKQWQAFLRFAASRKDEWRQLQSKDRVGDMQDPHRTALTGVALAKFLNVSYSPPTISSHLHNGSGYYHYTPADAGAHPVRARLLNRGQGGVIVGIGGFTGSFSRLADRQVPSHGGRCERWVYVRNAYLVNGVTPEIDVSESPLGPNQANVNRVLGLRNRKSHFSANTFKKLEARHSRLNNQTSLADKFLRSPSAHAPMGGGSPAAGTKNLATQDHPAATGAHDTLARLRATLVSGIDNQRSPPPSAQSSHVKYPLGMVNPANPRNGDNQN